MAASPTIQAALDPATPPLYVGVYRFAFGQTLQSDDDMQWTARAKSYAAQIGGANPVIVHRLSSMLSDGVTQFTFPLPVGFSGSTSHMRFVPKSDTTERSLKIYDAEGVQTILLVQPGSADVLDCFDVVLAAFSRHPCIVGLGVDVETYRSTESGDGVGRPVSDVNCRRWMERLLRFKPTALLVLKHFEPQYMPPSYRHPGICLLTDSRGFSTEAEWLTEMREWQAALGGAQLGAVGGFSDDAQWWSILDMPPVAFGRQLQHEWAGRCRLVLWANLARYPARFGPSP